MAFIDRQYGTYSAIKLTKCLLTSFNFSFVTHYMTLFFANQLFKLLKTIALGICLLCFISIASAQESSFLVLNYHDIIDDKKETDDAVDLKQKNFADQLQWLKTNHYTVISVQQIFDAAAGKTTLPAKAVALTFDDGYESFYTRALPLLKKYKYPATVSLVGSWMSENSDEDNKPKKALMTWAQIKELTESGLIEIASHSYDLHRGILGNPQGNTQAAAVTRLYDDPMLIYESSLDYQERVQNDLIKSSEHIFQHAGVRPRVMVWPYGEYNQLTLMAARKAGMPMTMGLIDGTNTLADIDHLKRLLIAYDPDVKEFAKIVSNLRADRPLRVAHIDLDYLYDSTPTQLAHNIDIEIERIRDMHITTVYLQAYADPDGDGNADALYFPNRHLPVKADLFNRVAWQLKKIANVRVYAWMPILAYQESDIPKTWYVQEWRDGKPQSASHIYTRLSPFNPEARQYITDIYEDLAIHCNFDGLLFHDDGILSDFEDVSPLALEYGREVWGLSTDFNVLHKDPKLSLRWAKHKTEFINQFTDDLTNRVRFYRPGIKTARNFYSYPLLKPYSEEWFAQSFDSFLAHYDYVAIEAMPFMEEASNPTEWLTDLVKKAATYPNGLEKTVFELQTVDWRNSQKIPMDTFLGQVSLLQKLGAKHLGYYPDNVFDNQPNLKDLQTKFTVPTSLN